jgi:hypothetical protein
VAFRRGLLYSKRDKGHLPTGEGASSLTWAVDLAPAIEAIMRTRPAVVLSLLGILAMLIGGCATVGDPEQAAGPGVPRISHLRFEPDVIRAGESTQMSFYFEVGSADLDECVVMERGVSQFQLYTSLQPIVVPLKQYSGLVAGTVEMPMRWSEPGVRSIEVYAVSKQGKAGNRLRATLTVR